MTYRYFVGEQEVQPTEELKNKITNQLVSAFGLRKGDSDDSEIRINKKSKA